MDGWKDRTKSGRKENGFENLKTRFQDCNLSRKQESKLSGWNENGLPVNRDGKFSANQENNPSTKQAIRLCGKNERKEASDNESEKANKEELFLAYLLAGLNERKLSVHRYGWQPIMMYNNNSK